MRSEDGETRIIPLAELRAEMGGERVHEPTGEQEAFVSTEEVPEEVIRLMDTVELPMWVPRTPDAPRPPGSRQLPVAPASGAGMRTPDRVNIIADPEPEPDEADEDNESDDGDEPGVAPESATETSQPSDAGARPERRRRRRGRRGGRRNRGQDRGRGGNGAQGGGDGTPGGGGPRPHGGGSAS